MILNSLWRGRRSRTWTAIILTGLALALAVFALEWLEYRFWSRALGVETFITLVGTGCIGLGIWLGIRLTRQAPARPFQRNDAAIRTLGLTPRELDVLEALVGGGSNKELARQLGVSPNTVKTHMARLFDKLDASGRVQAIETARTLRLIPAPGDRTGDLSGTNG